MITLKRLAPLLAGLAVCVAPALHAERAWGEFTIEFGDNLKLWDLSGSYSEDLDGLSLDYTISSEPSGKFTGQGTATVSGFWGYDVDLGMDFTVNGGVNSAGSVTRVNLTMKMSGSGWVEGYYLTMKATVTEKLEVDSATMQMLGTYSGNVSVSVPSMHKSAKARIPKTDVQTSLPEGATGDWDLTLNVTTNLNKFAGSAMVHVDNRASIPLMLTGSYQPKSGLSKLTLKGQGLFRSAQMNLGIACTNAGVTLKSLSGKVLGQKLKLPASP